MARKRRSKKSGKFSDTAAIAFAAFVFAMLISTSHESNQQHKYTDTPQNIETMVRFLLDQDATATMRAVLSYTPTPTETPTPTSTPTETPKPTPTPTLTDIPSSLGALLPSIMEGSSSSSFAGASSDSGCHSPDCGCVIKGNISYNSNEKIYHCPNDPSYDKTKINPAKGERWFCSVEEAELAGFRAPTNAPRCEF